MAKWSSERSIHEMLKDTPPLGDSSDSITSGTEPKITLTRSSTFPSAYAPPDVSQNSTSGVLQSSASRIDSLRSWGLSTYKCTKQLLYEKLGKSSRTVDTELEAEISDVRETQRKYQALLRLNTQLTEQLAAAADTQRALGELFAELAQRGPELRPALLANADSQRSLARHAEPLLSALGQFGAALNTLCHRAAHDALLTVRRYEAARREYDAYRAELEASGGNPPEHLLRDIERRRAVYERLREDVAAKLTLLREHRARNMRHHLALYHRATAGYYGGNRAALDAAC